METTGICNIITDSDPSGKALMAALGQYKHIFAVADDNVLDKSSFLCSMADVLAARGIPLLTIKASEQGKVMDTVLEICAWLLENGADRDALVLAIGGGITTDMTGFAASIYKRGVCFAYVPTTLLAQVDAAIGGKTGVNFDKYKNIIGVIRQPEFTYLNPHVLHSLPRRDFLSGAAEMLKTFIISDNGNYAKACDYISSSSDETDSLEELIEAAARVKAEVVSCDQFEKGRRRLLNLGHTFAHAIETLARRKAEEMITSETASQALEYDITHGEAVSMGIILAARLAEAVSAENEDINVAKGLAATLEADFRACKMPVDCPFTIEEMAPIMTKDKKAEGGIIHFVLPLSIGNVTILDLTATHVAEIMK